MFSRSQSELEIFAKRAAETYITTQLSPTESVVKLAEANNLSTEQIKRVCEFANHKINEHLLKHAQSRTFEFPLADYGEVVSRLNAPEIIDDSGCDYLLPPKVASAMPTQFCVSIGNTGITGNTNNKGMDKTAAKKETILKLKELYANAEHIKIASIQKASGLRENMYDMISKMVDSGYKIEDLYTAAKTASNKKETVRDVFKYITARLKEDGKLQKAVKISLNKNAGDSVGPCEIRRPEGRNWVRVEILPGTLSADVVKLEESLSDAAKADAAMGHISSMIDTVKTVNK